MAWTVNPAPSARKIIVTDPVSMSQNIGNAKAVMRTVPTRYWVRRPERSLSAPNSGIVTTWVEPAAITHSSIVVRDTPTCSVPWSSLPLMRM